MGDSRRARVHSYDSDEPETPFIDHPVGANLFLEGRWRHFLCYRVTGLHETDGKGAPPGPHTGLYIDGGRLRQHFPAGLVAQQRLRRLKEFVAQTLSTNHPQIRRSSH